MAPARNEHQQRVLRALGVTPLGLRGRFRPDPGAAGCMSGPSAMTGLPTCVLVLPAQCAARERALLQHVVRALGPGFAHAERIEVVAGAVAKPVPRADAYLAFGEAQAQALARSLPVATTVEVLALDPPSALFSAEGKRRLWLTVRALCRRSRNASTAVE